jgi:hypothetical protein
LVFGDELSASDLDCLFTNTHTTVTTVQQNTQFMLST